jgi:hypothetical protein
MMEQLLLHLVGDYITQSHWMANGKTKYSWIAAIHATVYALPFAMIGTWWAVGAIGVSHFFVDRFRLARFVIFAKNHLGIYSPSLTWDDCKATGYPSSVPPWMTVWLLIITDNTLHLVMNYAAIRWLR